MPDHVRATSLSQQQLVAKQIHTTKEKAKLGTQTKRCMDVVEYNYHLAKKIRTEGKLFRTVIPHDIQPFSQFIVLSHKVNTVHEDLLD